MATRAPAPSRLIAWASEHFLPAGTLTRLRTGREWRRWVEELSSELFDDLQQAPTEVKRSLFKRHVALVEIETHARCNRICPFCPNVIVDRRRNRVQTSRGLLEGVFRELGSIAYDRQIKVARYSEPLADLDALVTCLASARVLVPRAQLAIVTNTDYLTPPVLAALTDVGLDILHLSIYLRARERWSLALARDYNHRLAAKLGLRIGSYAESPTGLHCQFDHPSLEIRSACMDFGTYGTDRGGIMQQYASLERLGPCREPFHHLVIDYTGLVVPCCNIRSDLPEHAGLSVGDLSVPGTSIFDIYAGRLAAWRRSMVGFGRKASPCTTCRHRDVPAEMAPEIGRRLRRKLTTIGRADILDAALA